MKCLKFYNIYSMFIYYTGFAVYFRRLLTILLKDDCIGSY